MSVIVIASSEGALSVLRPAEGIFGYLKWPVASVQRPLSSEQPPNSDVILRKHRRLGPSSWLLREFGRDPVPIVCVLRGVHESVLGRY